MTFLIVIFFIGLFFYYFPRILMWAVSMFVKRRIRRMGQQFQGASGGRNGSTGKRGHDRTQPKPQTKKIDPDVGEYIHFEEVDVTSETTATTQPDGSETKTTRVKVEEQIVDIDWEDVK